MRIGFKIKKEDMFSLLVWWIWSQDILVQYVRAVIMRLPYIGAYPDTVLAFVFVAIILAALPYYRMTKGDLVFLFSVVVIFVYQWAFHSETQEYLEHYMVSFVVKILPLYIVGVSLGKSENQEKIIRVMYILSIVTLITDLFYKLVIGIPMSAVASQYEGDMDRAYKILPHCCLIAYYAVKRTNIWNIGFSVLGGIYLLFLGTRGAAMLYLLLVTLLLIMGRRSKGAILRIVIVSGTIAVFLMSPLYNSAILWLYQMAQKLGLSIRIFDKMLNGVLGVSSGRDTIRETLMDSVTNGPLFGLGICMDRVLIGTYAHNIAIELWVDFGVFVGTAILVVLTVVLVCGYLKAEGEGEKGLILCLVFGCFLKLFLSGSYLSERLLMLLLGLCVSSIRKKGSNRMRRVNL